MFRPILVIASALFLAAFSAQSQTITIDGVTDRSTYTDSVTLRVQTNTGFSYDVRLNGAPIAAGIFHTVNRMDYYDLTVRRVNDTTSGTTNVLVRFIVLSSRRGDPERGLVEWVPLPPIPSTAAEMAGAQLDLMTPLNYPAGLDIPVIARVENANGSVRRVNGWVNAPGYESSAFRILRGVGFGLLPPAISGTNISFNGRLQSLQTTKQINIESNTAWTTVSGILGTTTWSNESRIHVTGNITIPAGVTLTIEAGTVVRLNAGVNITNTGRTVINGTPTQPVVFTATNRVAPEQRTGAWGGWFLRGAAAELIANNAIMTGCGAAGSISFSPGSSHRTEQPVLLVHNATVRMTNCALINNAGQIGNGYYATITLERCLWQRAITVGEYEGCTNIIRNSALIEFPSIDGIYDATIASADYDGMYMILGTNFFANSLLGFCKDDALDSGSDDSGDPLGTVRVENCWIESALHESMAWSGNNRKTWVYDTVSLNSGQGIECGWSGSTAVPSPICYASNLLSTANSVGARLGDNYTGTTGLGLKNGFLTVTNSFILNNYRDVWGQVWDNTWNYRTGQMDIRSNYVTAANTNHPDNAIWNPGTDGWRLASFMTTPPGAPVGIGLAAWNLQLNSANLTNGIPVRLSSFTTNFVSVDYAIETPSAAVANGTLTFAPGETVKYIFGNPAALGGATTWRVALQNPSGGEVTGDSAAYVLPALPTNGAPATALVPSGAAWKYLDDGSDQGSTWRGTNFSDNTWSNGVAQLGFGDNPVDEITRIRRTNSAGATIVTFYFRRAFNFTNTSGFTSLAMSMLRDDGGVVYLNGTEVFRSPSMPPTPAAITYTTFANQQGSAPADNTIDTASLSPALLRIGTNVVAVEIHQFDAGSSDASFDFSLTGNTSAAPPRLAALEFGDDLILYWNASGFVIEQASQVTGPWSYLSAVSPVTVTKSESQQFFRLRKP